MPSARQHKIDFLVAMGEEFSELVSPPVPFFEAAPNECCEAIQLALGKDVTPEKLASLTESDFLRIAQSFAHWFECEPPQTMQVAEAVARTLHRWPIGSISGSA